MSHDKTAVQHLFQWTIPPKQFAKYQESSNMTAFRILNILSPDSAQDSVPDSDKQKP